MKNISIKIFWLILVTVLLSSCYGIYGLNKTKFSSKKVNKLNKVALISTLIEFSPPADETLFTPVMNEKINSISGELNLLFKDYATFYRDSLGKFISQNYNCVVLYGESLQSNPGFAKLKAEYNFPNALATGNASFPLIFESSGDINPFNELKGFTASKPDTTLLSQHRKTIQAICKNLNVDFIALSYTNVIAQSGTAVVKGALTLFTSFSIFDKDGDYIAWGNQMGNLGKSIKGNKIEEYPPVLNTYYAAFKPILSEIYRKYSTK